MFSDLSYVLPPSKKCLLENENLGAKKLFYEYVAEFCLKFGTNSLASCVLHGNYIFDGCDKYIICTTTWFTKICLESKKWLSYKNFISKDTTLLV